ncbi:MAG: nucleotidyltransferase domain-containing protein [Acidimicrobiales bacterium]
MSFDLDGLVGRLTAVPGVVAVTLGGSRATGENAPDADWDIGVYYERSLDTDAIRAWGWAGEVFEPGDWAGFMHGGAWLHHDGHKIDLIYREISEVDRWIDAAAEGEWELSRVPGYLAGMPSYTLAAELALGQTLSGTVPSAEFTDALAGSAERRWRWEAEFALTHARFHLDRTDHTLTRGFVVFALLALAHGRLAAHYEWVRNEKGLLEKAALAPAGNRFDLIAEQHGMKAAVAWVAESLDLTR